MSRLRCEADAALFSSGYIGTNFLDILDINGYPYSLDTIRVWYE